MRRTCVISASAAALLSLSACGGGDEGSGGLSGGENTDPTNATYTQFTDAASTENSQLIYIAIDSGGDRTSGTAGTLDHDTFVISAGALAGLLSGDFTEIALNGGGTATLTNPSSTEYTRVFTTSGAGDPLFGVLGQRTEAVDLPNGTSSLGGRVSLSVSSGGVPYTLTGNATVTVDWDADLVDTRFFSLSGKRTDTDASVSGVGTIRIDNAALSGGTFTGGTASTTGSFEPLVSASTNGTQGALFGPNADEAGGTVVVDDTGAGDFLAIGVYTAE
ncbi:MAG: transferrin-binding protein-like solute binding protein [Alphaproteobacteria bacterium]|nr:transferrin-binding protein-like solute binding protein [Alphaproteobacteria bacterium]NNF24853.1 hypothetical protein [Paracoccaceae bacterium]